MLHFFANLNAQTITTFAGNGTSSCTAIGDGGPATDAVVNIPGFGTFDIFGNYYYCDCITCPRIRKISTSGIITTIVGCGVAGFSGDGGLASLATLGGQNPFAIDSLGNIFIADYYNNRVRKVDVSTGVIITIAGNGSSASTGDGGPASAASISPIDIAIDRHHNLYISENAGGIRKIDNSGIITTVLGINAQGMCFDTSDNLFLGCALRVCKVNLNTGVIDTIGGRGGYIYNGDEISADSANFRVYDIAVDAKGNIYIADHVNARVRMIDTSRIIHTVAGTGICDYGGDGGPADSAKICLPEGLAVDACNNLYIADLQNNRIRKVKFPPDPHISIYAIPSSSLGSIVNVTANVINVGYSYTIKWYNKGVLFNTTTVPTVTYTKTMLIDSITAVVYGCNDSAISDLHIVADPSVEVSGVPLQSGIQIWPNPATTILNVIAANLLCSVTMTNLLGQTVLYREGRTKKMTVDIGQLQKGVYVVRVVDNEGNTIIKQLVKE